MYYLVCAETKDKRSAVKFGYAKWEGTVGKRIENAKRLLGANGFLTVTHVQTGPADVKTEKAVHQVLKRKFARPATGHHADGADECYLDATLDDCIVALGLVGLGLLGILNVLREDEGDAQTKTTWLELFKAATLKAAELKDQRSATLRRRKQLGTLAWTTFGGLLVSAASVVVVASGSETVLPVQDPSGVWRESAFVAGGVCLFGWVIMLFALSHYGSGVADLDRSIAKEERTIRELEIAAIHFRWHRAEDFSLGGVPDDSA